MKKRSSRFGSDGLTAEEIRSANRGYNFHRLFAQLTGEMREVRVDEN